MKRSKAKYRIEIYPNGQWYVQFLANGRWGIEIAQGKAEGAEGVRRHLVAQKEADKAIALDKAKRGYSHAWNAGRITSEVVG